MRRREKVFLLSFLCLAFLIFVAVQAPEQAGMRWKGKILKDGEIELIKNPENPVYDERYLSLENDLVLGKNKKQEEYLLPGITHFAVDNQGLIYVLVGRDSHIRVFDGSGTYLRTMGRKGQGPGEFMNPMNIQILPDGKIFVNNMPRLTYYSGEGKLIRETKSTMPFAFRLAMDRQNGFLGIFPLASEPFKVVLGKYDSSQKPVYTFASTEPSSKDMLAPGFLFDITKDNLIIWGTTDKYEVNISRSDGTLLKKITRDYRPVVITEEDKKALTRKFTGGSETLPPGQTFPKYFTPIEEISVDEDSNIYVRTNERFEAGKGNYFDVFDPSGRFLAKVGVRAARRMPVIWKKDKVYTIQEDEEGFRTVYRYEIKTIIPR